MNLTNFRNYEKMSVFQVHLKYFSENFLPQFFFATRLTWEEKIYYSQKKTSGDGIEILLTDGTQSFRGLKNALIWVLELLNLVRN